MQTFNLFNQIVTLVLSVACSISLVECLSPVILMPGYGGSKLEARWKPQYARDGACPRSSKWTTLWVDYTKLLPINAQCLIETMELTFDNSTGQTRNKPGLEIRVKEFDRISNVEYLTDHTFMGYEYFATIVRKLVSSLGYERDITIQGAPYDFRRAPNELGDYFQRLKQMCEEMFAESGSGSGVTLICHSMGCLNALYFLHQQSLEWKEKYIRRMISIAAPWGGSVMALRVIALGAELMPGFDPMLLSRLSRSFPSTFFLFPNQRVFQDQPLILVNSDSAHERGGSEVYTANNYQRLLELIDHQYELQVWQKTKSLLGNLEAPNVETHCFYGTGQKTVSRIQFTGDFPWSEEIKHYDYGDGTVTKQSGCFCQQWKYEQSKSVHAQIIKANHMEILKNSRVLDLIVGILREN